MEKNNLHIENMIYEIRGKEVMLDTDIAKLYQVDTKRINEAVKNNPNKFPERFCWTLTKEEYLFLRSNISTLKNLKSEIYDDDIILRSQIATLKNDDNRGKHSKYLPKVFTEQGLYMLATILKSKVATNVSIAIMDTFVKMRHYINYNKIMLPNRMLLLEDKVDNNTIRINELFDKFDPKEIAKNYLFFEGEHFKSNYVLSKIFDSAYEEIIIIDNYADKELLKVLSEINKKIIVVSKNMNDSLIKKYNKEFNNIEFIKREVYHDRFIIIDRSKLYSCGSSFKDLGKKCFAINEMSDEFFIDRILNDIFK